MPQLYTKLEQKSNSVQTWSNSKGDVISIQQSQNGEVKHKQLSERVVLIYVTQ